MPALSRKSVGQSINEMAEDHYGRIIKDGVPQCNAVYGWMDREDEEIINDGAIHGAAGEWNEK